MTRTIGFPGGTWQRTEKLISTGDVQSTIQRKQMVSFVTGNSASIGELCRRYSVRRLELFGSAVPEELADGSDLDFLVEFEPRSSGQFDADFGLKEDLEALFDRPVDLVVASAIRNRYFLESVNRHREVVYGAS